MSIRGMSREIQLGWAGLVLAVIGILLDVVGLVGESVGIAIIGLSLFVMVIGVLSLLYKAQEQLNSSVGQLNEIRRSLEAPPFTTLNVVRTLTFEDAAAHKAEFTDTRRIQVNHRGISEYWFRQLAPPERIHDKLIDGEEPHDEAQELGLVRLCKKFPRNLSRGESFESTLTANYIDAFPDDTEFFVHSIMDPTEKLRLEVKFHPDKPCLEARTLVGYGAGSYELLEGDQPVRSNQGRKLEFEIENLNRGQNYRIEWDW